MTINQKIFAISALSVFALIMITVGGVILNNMLNKGKTTSNTKPPVVAEESTDEEAVTEDTVSPADSSSKGQIAEEELPEEKEAAGRPAAWLTYANEFYTIEYPANYKISGQTPAGELNFQINGFDAEAVIFISGGKKALAFHGTWSVIPEAQATDQKLLDIEIVDMNGVRFEKKYWALRQVGNGAWLTAIVYYGCSQDGNCFSLLRGVTAEGITAWPETTGAQLVDKTKIKTLVNVMKTSKETDTINFNNMFLTFRFVEKPAASGAPAANSAVSKTSKWKDYVFSPIITASAESTDRKLVCIDDDGTQKIITESVKTTMGWNGMAEFYPNKVLFTPYSKEIYFTKYLSDSGSSSGVYALDVVTLQSRRLANVGKILEIA